MSIIQPTASQKHIEENQKEQAAADVGLYIGEQARWNFRINEVIGIGHGRGQDDKNAADKYHAVADDLRQLPNGDLATD